MKKCDHFKELILTDYIDGVMKKDSVMELEDHLLKCGECGAFLKEVKGAPALFFHQVARQPVPGELWDTIARRIEDERRQTGFIGDIISKLKGPVFFPRLVPVFASLMLMLLVGSVTRNFIQVRQASAQDQGEYLVSLLSPAIASDSNDLGTPIEHYFL